MQKLQLDKTKKLLLGAIHLPSFIGKSQTELRAIETKTLENALIFEKGGFDGVFIQDQTIGATNFDSICNLTGVTRFVTQNTHTIKIGSQMECDDAKSILAVAKASNASFVRIKTYVGTMIKSCGLVHGQGNDALKYKVENNIDATILCDIFDRCGTPLGETSMIEACKMALNLGAEGLVITGKSYEDTLEMIKAIKKEIPSSFILCGGSVTNNNVQEVLSICDGAIVSSCLKDEKNSSIWSLEKIREFVNCANH